MKIAYRSFTLGLTIGFSLGLVPSILLGDPVNLLCRRSQIVATKPEQFGENSKAAVIRKGTTEDRSKSNNTFRAPYRIVQSPSKKHYRNVSNTKPVVRVLQSPRKVLLDCGANVASTALLFRETYPGGSDFTIHSFEIDERLSPYFKPFDNLQLHCPVGVAGKNGNMTAFSEMAWGPDKGRNYGQDMQWGGGSLFVSEKELKDEKTGGSRKLSHRKTIPVVDLSQWIMRTFSIDDYIIFKLDVEGAEYETLRKMLNDKAFTFIDKYYGEYHDYQPTGWSKKDQDQIRADIMNAGFKMIDWVGERRTYGDIEEMNPIMVPLDTPGKAGGIYSRCESGSVALVIAVGMNYKRAHRVVATLAAHKPVVPATLFVYGDFAQEFPETVMSWAEHFNIGIREDGHNPPGHLELMPDHWIRMGLISAILRLEEIGLTAAYYLPTVVGEISTTISKQAKQRGLRIVKPAVEFPAKKGSEAQLTRDNYYKYRDVERVPKALRRIHEGLVKNGGGVLALDTDLPDTYMNSVFMMDYLVETSGFKLVDLHECVSLHSGSRSERSLTTGYKMLILGLLLISLKL